MPFFPLGGFSPLQSAVLDDVAAGLGASPMQVALAWLLQRSPAILAIPGTSSVAHLRDNLAAGRLQLPASAVAELDAIGRPAADPPAPAPPPRIPGDFGHSGRLFHARDLRQEPRARIQGRGEGSGVGEEARHQLGDVVARAPSAAPDRRPRGDDVLGRIVATGDVVSPSAAKTCRASVRPARFAPTVLAVGP